MAKGFKKGVGGANLLNFTVVGGTAEPNNPSVNTIWVNTDQKITSWTFGVTQPATPSNGQVWIKTGTASHKEFNALKKNCINIYPINSYQYNGNSWAIVSSKVYQNGIWNNLTVPLTIVPDNSTYPASVWSKVGSASISVADTTVKASYSDYDNDDPNMVYIDIDVTNYTVMELVGTTTAKASNTGTTSVNLKTGVFSGTDLVVGYSTALSGGTVATIDNVYDISSLTGTYRFGFYFQVSSTSSYEGNFTMTSVVFS